MYDVIMFRQTIFVILTKNITIYALHTYSSHSRWLREIALKTNTMWFISIISVQQQLLKSELFIIIFW